MWPLIEPPGRASIAPPSDGAAMDKDEKAIFWCRWTTRVHASCVEAATRAADLFASRVAASSVTGRV
eukprot:scaffold8311_cov71-Phaeocystis_antarctica.AAC.9